MLLDQLKETAHFTSVEQVIAKYRFDYNKGEE